MREGKGNSVSKVILKKGASLYKVGKFGSLTGRIKDTTVKPSTSNLEITGDTTVDLISSAGRYLTISGKVAGKKGYLTVKAEVSTGDTKEYKGSGISEKEQTRRENVQHRSTAYLAGWLYSGVKIGSKPKKCYNMAPCEVLSGPTKNDGKYPYRVKVLSDGNTGYANGVVTGNQNVRNYDKQTAIDQWNNDKYSSAATTGNVSAYDAGTNVTLISHDSSSAMKGSYSSIDEIQNELDRIYANAPQVVQSRIAKHKETIRLAKEYINTHYDYERLK